MKKLALSFLFFLFSSIGMGLYAQCTLDVNSISIIAQPMCSIDIGSVQLIVTGGSNGYQYSLDNISYSDLSENGVISGLAAGTYSFYIRDKVNTSCIAVSPAITLRPMDTDLDVRVTSTDASSCGASNGNLTVNVTGGTTPYQYSIDGGNSWTPFSGNNTTIGSKTPGKHVVYIKDANNCIVSSGEVIINAADGGLNAAAVASPHTTCGNTDGAFTVTFNGTAPYTYRLNGGIVTTTSNASISFSSLAAGSHSWNITDAAGCYAEGKTLINNNTTSFAATAATTPAYCDGTSGGSITLNLTNGTAPYEYSMDGGDSWTAFTGSSTTTIPNLAQGTYNIVVRDNTGCTYSYNNAVIESSDRSDLQISTTHVVSQPTCAASSGSIYVAVTGGSGSYEYAYSRNGAVLTSYTPLPFNGIIGGLAAGTYRIYVRDMNAPACGTAVSPAITLRSTDTDLDMQVTPNNATACGTANGSLTVNVTGGATPYKYSLDNGTEVATFPTSFTISDIAPGKHVMYIKDANGCIVSSGEVLINADGGGLNVTAAASSHTTCGNTDGAFSITFSGTAPYTCRLNGKTERTAVNNTINIDRLAAGSYTWSVTDAVGCYAEGRVLIANFDNNNFAATAATTDADCDGTTGGSIILNLTGGEAPYQYSIDGGVSWMSFTGSSTTTIPNLPQGTYSITVLDNTGCTYTYSGAVVGRTPPPTPPVAASVQTFCNGATIKNITVRGYNNIIWYDSPIAGNILPQPTPLVGGAIYYVARRIGSCESTTRTAVKTIIDDSMVLPAPKVHSPQYLCGLATLADIILPASINPADVLWYDQAVGGNIITDITTPLTDSTSYYIALSAGGTCQSVARTEVFVVLGDDMPNAPTLATPQSFCAAAILADIAVPNNQLLWYENATGGTPLDITTTLIGGTTYYAAQKAGSCQSSQRQPVAVAIGTPAKPVAAPVQAICSGAGSLVDLNVTGSGIAWYDENSNDLPLSTVLVENVTYYAAQTSGSCTGEQVDITVTFNCYDIKGTVFPFVYEADPNFDKLFPVTASLYAIPAGVKPITLVQDYNNKPQYIAKATLYDGTFFIPGTPKYPGAIGLFNNPGLPIDWSSIEKDRGTVENAELTGIGDLPTSNIGLFELNQVGQGSYVLELSRRGYLTRWAYITVNADGFVSHRELLAGDVNGDGEITAADLTLIKKHIAVYGTTKYDPAYDVNGDGLVDYRDISIFLSTYGATYKIYDETQDLVNSH